MRKNPGRKDSRVKNRELRGKGDAGRKKTQRMQTHDGMVASGHFVRTPQGLAKVT